MRVLVYGAGVIGRIYAGRLIEAGHDVTMLAREPGAGRLAEAGITLRTNGRTSHFRPHVLTAVPPDGGYDVALVTVRRDQLAPVAPLLSDVPADRVAFLLNQAGDLETVRDSAGADRTVFAFPGVGGRRTGDGTIEYLQIRQQKTTVERRGGIEAPVVALLRSAAFPLDVRPDIPAWLATHTVFITTVGAAILAAGGDSGRLAADRAAVADMVTAVGEGFRALRRAGIPVVPTPLRLIFTVMPRFAAVGYWRRQLAGPLGSTAIAPHVAATRATEFPLMCADVRRLVGGHGPAPHLDRLLDLTEDSS